MHFGIIEVLECSKVEEVAFICDLELYHWFPPLILRYIGPYTTYSMICDPVARERRSTMEGLGRLFCFYSMQDDTRGSKKTGLPRQ